MVVILPLPEWFVGNKIVMQYFQLLPIAMMYVIPTLILGGIALITVQEYLFNNDEFPVNGKTVVITGGSQGLGRGLAKVFAKNGANVVIVARTKQKLKEASEYISTAARYPEKQRFAYISADLTIPSENTRVISEVTAWNAAKPPDIVWANAGTSEPCLFLDASTEHLHRQFAVNYWASVYLAQATLRAWLVPGPGSSSSTSIAAFPDGTPRRTKPDPRHFIMTSSAAAFVGLAGYAPYSPAKAALRNLHDTLRSEVALYNGANARTLVPDVKLHTVFPGGIDSPGYEAENRLKHPVTKMLEESDPLQSEDVVAEAAFRELEKGRAMVTTQMIAAAMRASSLQGSPRDRWFVDTVFSWLSGIIWLFVAPSLEKKVWKWGRENGLPKHEAA